jgi:pyroglutamyl-peptidase
LTTDQKVRGSNPLGRAMQKILLTGFEKFHTATSNPTQAIVEELERSNIPGLVTAVLPVEFSRSWQILKELIAASNPKTVIALGQAEGRSQITPEKIAINLDNARIPDNAGNSPVDQPIVSGGADGLFSTLPIDLYVERLKQADIPASISYSAGTYVCNHLFYALQNYSKGKGIQSGFIHLPLMESQANEFPGLPTLPLETMVQAIKEILLFHK